MGGRRRALLHGHLSPSGRGLGLKRVSGAGHLSGHLWEGRRKKTGVHEKNRHGRQGVATDRQEGGGGEGRKGGLRNGRKEGISSPCLPARMALAGKMPTTSVVSCACGAMPSHCCLLLSMLLLSLSLRILCVCMYVACMSLLNVYSRQPSCMSPNSACPIVYATYVWNLHHFPPAMLCVCNMCCPYSMPLSLCVWHCFLPSPTTGILTVCLHTTLSI